ncbi:MAG TPA: oligosaccharide flippase family protein [Terriglobales bacterium]|nr:oligosaccharide flippase family protein [Terriglobales bacterium]
MGDEAIEAATAVASAETPLTQRHSTIRELRLRVLSGSATMLLSSVLVSLINLIYNFAIAHALGADNFGHVSVVYTILMLLSCATLAFQLLCSKFVARSESQPERIAIYHLLHRRSWMVGLGVGLLLAVGSPAVSGYLNLPSPLLIQVLAIGIVFYIPLGTRRGFMQGTTDFAPLAVNYVLEVVVKLIATVILIWAGYGVPGVVGAMSASVIVAFFVAIPRKHHVVDIPEAKLQSGMVEGVQALIFFVGQVVIGNLHIVLVKHFFTATQAGVYAAVALIGRVAYMFSWSVVSSMFPFSAGIRSGERGGRAVLSTALLLSAGISTAFTLAAWLAPSEFWPLLLGKGFPIGGHHSYAFLVVLYTVATGIYSLSVVLMTYEISRKIGNVSWLQLGFSGAIVIGIYVFHNTLQDVIYVQLVLMAVLMAVVSSPFLRRQLETERVVDPIQVPRFESGLRKVKLLDENEVIAEFLRGEFYQDEFAPYRKRFSKLVTQPDLTNPRENSLRRALLFRRRGRLWLEIPADTEWWEVEMSSLDIYRMRVFPRNQWLRYGVPSFLLPETVQRIRTRLLSDSTDPFIEKLRSLSLEMKQNSKFSSVILITIDERTPLTIVEGNHRMTAAALGNPEEIPQRFRFMCGFSSHMAECCWYQTDVNTLWRYAKNTVGYFVKHRRKVVAEIAAGILGETEGSNSRDESSSSAA